MMRWFSIGVICYMILGIVWWGMLLFGKNQDLYDLKLSQAEGEEIAIIEKERGKQNMMIIGEGIVLGLSLLAGVYIINRSAQREIKSAKQQSNFLLSVSHELKSPIAAIKLALETLSRPNLPEAAASTITSSAVKDADRLEKLVQNILLSASIEESKLELYKEEVDVNSLVEKIVNRYNYNDKKIEVISNKRGAQATLHIDTYNITQALTNVIDNAIKYTEKNSLITVEVTDNDEGVIISVVNKGIPIPSAEREMIFKKFYRGQDKQIRKKEGTGIGLYIAQEVVKAHGGLIISNNDGTDLVRFDITLPR